jgi:Domain of unknown function (DUF4194)
LENEQEQEQRPDQFAALAIRLMHGVIYDEEARLWTELTKVHEVPLRRYFGQIGVQLIVNQSEGFAFLRQATDAVGGEEEANALPRLMRKRNLTIDQSILCVLLRERIEDHTMLDTASREPILPLKEITNLVDVFFKERNTQQRFLKDVKKTVEDLRAMGFLELVGERSAEARLEGERYRIKRIIKAFIDTDELHELSQQLISNKPA